MKKERDPFTDLVNIGGAVARQLHAAGVDTPDDLRAIGAREAWRRILSMDDSACMHRLLALEGAVRGVQKKALPQDVREELRAFYRKEKGK